MRSSRGLLLIHGALMTLLTCGSASYLDRLMTQSFGQAHDIFFTSTPLILLQTSLTTMFLSFAGAAGYSVTRAWRKRKAVRLTFEPKFEIRSYLFIAILSTACTGSWIESSKMVTSATLAVAAIPIPALLLAVLLLLGNHCSHPKLILAFLPSLGGVAFYLYLLPSPRNSFDREDSILGASLLIFRAILFPLLLYFYSTDFPAPTSIDEDVSEEEAVEHNVLTLANYSPFNRRLTPLLDASLFSSIFSTIFASALIYNSIMLGSSPISLSLVAEQYAIRLPFLRLSFCLATQAMVVLSTIGVAGPFVTSLLFAFSYSTSFIYLETMRVEWVKVQTHTLKVAALISIGLWALLYRSNLCVLRGARGELCDRSEGETFLKRLVPLDRILDGGDRRSNGLLREVTLYCLGILMLVVPLFPRTSVPLPDRLLDLFRQLDLTPNACPSFSPPQRWNGTVRTILASNPRSGNTFVRELTESAFGWQSSTESYCDLVLSSTLRGECDHEANFLVKSHYPSRLAETDVTWPARVQANQVVHLVRNPIDTIYSWHHLAHVAKTRHGQLNHASRLRLDHLLGSTAEELHDLKLRAKVYAHHEAFWHNAAEKVPRLVIRYEDIASKGNDRLEQLLRIRSFLLPETTGNSTSNDGARLFDLRKEDLVRVGCAVADSLEGKGETGTLAAYRSSRPRTFASTDEWDPQALREVLDIVQVSWCSLGYEDLWLASGEEETGLCPRTGSEGSVTYVWVS